MNIFYHQSKYAKSGIYIYQIYYDYISHQSCISHLNDKPIYIYIYIYIYFYIYHELERLLRPASPPSLQRCSSSQQQQQPAVAAVMAEWKRCGV